MLRLLVINDNHFVKENDLYIFKGSKFHLFLKGFEKSDVVLSSPTIIRNAPREIIIDHVKVLTRKGYGSAIGFYKNIFFSFIKHYQDLKRHIKTADVVLLVAPACSLPISYFICRVLKKQLALYIVGDVVEVIKQDRKSPFILRMLKLIASKWEWGITKYIAKRHTTFVLGSSLYNKLEPLALDLKFAMTSLVSKKMVVSPLRKPLQKPIRILTVSRLSTEKGIHIAIDAISRLVGVYSIEYIIVGDGEKRIELESQVKDMKLEKVISFTGYLDQKAIRRQYLDADIFMLPSFSEGIPKVILDAMATDTPIISTDVGGIPDLLSLDQKRGWLVPPGNIERLVDALHECIDKPHKRQEKTYLAHQYIKKHTLEEEAGRIESALLQIVADCCRGV